MAHDDVITRYVQHRLREYQKGGGELKALAERVGIPPSTPSQVLSGKLGVGNVNRPRFFAKAFNMLEVELVAEAHRWADAGKGMRSLPTRNEVFSHARGKQHELGMVAAIGLGVPLLTIDRVNTLAELAVGAAQWDKTRWTALYLQIHQLFEGELPGRAQEIQAEQVRARRPRKARRAE